jgi:hypothetical protein
MAIPQVNLPVPFADIPAEVKRLSEHGRGLRLEADLTYKMVAAVQECCPHPKEQLSHWTDYGGWSNARCGHCGKEW